MPQNKMEAYWQAGTEMDWSLVLSEQVTTLQNKHKNYQLAPFPMAVVIATLGSDKKETDKLCLSKKRLKEAWGGGLEI